MLAEDRWEGKENHGKNDSSWRRHQSVGGAALLSSSSLSLYALPHFPSRDLMATSPLHSPRYRHATQHASKLDTVPLCPPHHSHSSAAQCTGACTLAVVVTSTSHSHSHSSINLALTHCPRTVSTDDRPESARWRPPPRTARWRDKPKKCHVDG